MDIEGHAPTDSVAFWERIYQARSRPSTGIPNAILASVAPRLKASRALDLGCALGDDAIWLARNGWTVTAVDVSATALERAAARAVTLGVADRIDFQQHDLAHTFPAGAFDLVYALYLQSPIDFDRDRALRSAAAAVAPDGRLLVVVHGSVQPWSWNQEPHPRFPTPQEQFDALELAAGEWDVEINDTPRRQATGPNGETATATDVVTLVHRRSRAAID